MAEAANSLVAPSAHQQPFEQKQNIQNSESTETVENTAYDLVAQVGIALLPILLLILLWNRKLRREIERRAKAEQKLEKSRYLLEEAQSLAHMGNWELDPDTMKAIWSAEIYRILGIEYSEDVGPEKLATLLHPEDRDAVLASLQRVVKEGCRHNMQYRVLRPDGEMRWVECQAEQVRDEFGRIFKVRGVVQDITQRKIGELELLESETRFRSLAEAGFEAVFIAENGVCISQNIAAEKMFGYSLEEAVGQACNVWIAEESRALVAEKIESCYEGCYEAIAQRKDGVKFPAEFRGRMLKYQDRQVRVTALLDITVRKQVEHSLRQSEEKYRLLAENVSDVVWVRDMDLKLTYISPSVERLSGFTVAEKLAQSLEESMTPSSLAAMKSLFEQQVALERSDSADPARALTVNFELYHKDGSTCLTECSVSFLRHADGNAIGIIGVNRDITERIQAQEFQRQSEEKYRTLVESSPYCIHQIDQDGRFISMNRAGLEMINEQDENIIIGQHYLNAVCDGDKERITELLAAAYAGEYREFEFCSKGGHYFSSNFVPIRDAEGKVDRLLGITLDITERKKSEESLQKLSRAVEASSSAVIITDIQGQIEYVNPKFYEITGYSRAEVIGNNPRLLQSGETPQIVYTDLWQTISTGGEWKGEFHNRKKDGSLYWARNSISGVRNAEDVVTHFICIQDDVTHEYELTEKLSYQASHDLLTGLINRREFERRIDRLLLTAVHNSHEHALCYMDLDQFKVVNDTCGHTAGDEMLRQIATLLQKTVRQRDTLARLGGDEFGILMEHCSLKDAQRAATSVLEALQEYQFSWEGYSFSVGVSIGVVSLADVPPNMTELLKSADAACYVAKDMGRNRIHVYNCEDSEISLRHGQMQWVNRINHALEQDRFCLFAQAIVPLENHSGKHYELLIRMLDEDGDTIPPGAFLPAAERYTLMSKIDRWVINEGFDFLESQQQFLDGIESVAINLSGQSLAEEDFQNFVIGKFRSSPIPPGKICFEITETAAITSLSVATVFIAKMKVMGCRFALDDFGSGLSSFGYLKSLDVDYLKIDGMFVKDIVHDPIDRAMVKSINEIGQVMGMKTIAEFVENDEIKGMLREIGVDYAQGYGIGKPVPIEQLIPLFNADLIKS